MTPAKRRAKIRALHIEIGNLERECAAEGHHRHEQSTMCSGCLADLGWYCPKNPNGDSCEYAADDYVQDECIHCGQPDERK